jgi:prepilin-type processing-associated H-X9-DG protein
MNYYPTYWDDLLVENLAYIRPDPNPNRKVGLYVKQSRWTKPAQRALVMDSITHVVSTPVPFDSKGRWFPYDPIIFGAFYADAGRHGRYAMTKAESYNRPSVNVLFCDGHAETVSVRNAWNAIVNPGQDKAGP